MSGQLVFDETMSGCYSPAGSQSSRGFRIGRQQDHFIRGDFRIDIENADDFINNSTHEPALHGDGQNAT